VVRILYDFQRVYVKAVLTHKAYDTGKWKEQICLGLV
jgi:mRNA-degrading endonuclease HigB of HigAB toxin-antitoxin module